MFALLFGVSVVAAVLLRAGQIVNPTQTTISQDALTGLSHLAGAGVAVVLVVALTKLRGLPVHTLGWGPWWGRHRAYRWQAIGVALMFLGAAAVSTTLLGVLSPDAHFPYVGSSPWHLLFEVPAAINAGIVEELIVVALLVTVLEQARTRPALIYLIGIGLRLSYHVYYGPGVVALGLWAAAAIWLFRRCRRITPMIIAHAVYDTVGSLLHEFPSPSNAVAITVGLALLATAVFVVVRAIQLGARGRHASRPVGSLPGMPALAART